MAEEKILEQKFVKMTERRGWKALKLSGTGIAGMPDRIVLKNNGTIFFVELKAPGKTPRPVQRARMDSLRRMGFQVYMVDNSATAEAVLIREAGEE